MARRKDISRPRRTQGQHWVRDTTRLAVYLRDGMACCYCGAGVEDGARLTLDHVRPYSKGGSNDPSNLVTACHRCNSARGNRPVAEFARAVAAYLGHGVKAEDIVRHVRNVRRRKLDRAAARDLIARRGGFRAALYGEEDEMSTYTVCDPQGRCPEYIRAASPADAARAYVARWAANRPAGVPEDGDWTVDVDGADYVVRLDGRGGVEYVRPL